MELYTHPPGAPAPLLVGFGYVFDTSLFSLQPRFDQFESIISLSLDDVGELDQVRMRT